MAGAVVLGLGLGPIYPIVVAEISGRFGEAARRISAILFGMSALGGACLPWMVGFVSTRTGHLRTGLLVIFAGTLILIALSFISFQSITHHPTHSAD
jgi:fucose permease